ncbi:hypothetical protein K2173_024106 [Erythroxylum novogranatense]|uniref:Uncharacterized protein n=1 Tax=Erythroxylum novogranatense TaxID=1862640 RepID=A0AAV8UBN3_9ROSI|nr:hypothetical protein K2173_024106 [Erythroxylum novogranatense]
MSTTVKAPRNRPSERGLHGSQTVTTPLCPSVEGVEKPRGGEVPPGTECRLVVGNALGGSGSRLSEVKGGARSDVVARTPRALDEEARFWCSTSPFGPVRPFLGLGPGPWDLKWKLVGAGEVEPITGPKRCWWPSPLEEDARELAFAVPACVSNALPSIRPTYLEPNFGGDVWERSWEEGRWNRVARVTVGMEDGASCGLGPKI